MIRNIEFFGDLGAFGGKVVDGVGGSGGWSGWFFAAT